MTEVQTAKGIIYGLAIGDALGCPTEFKTLPAIKASYGPRGIQELPDPALFTDDTQMSIAIAEALIDAGDQDIETLMDAVKKHFISWLHSPENNRAPGTTCLQGVRNLERGMRWSESGVAKSKGCGSAMRAATIGYYYQNDPEKLREVAHATGICTHGHPTADAACIAVAYLVKLILDGEKPARLMDRTLEFTSGISDEFDRAIIKVRECLPWADEEKALAFLGEGWVGEEAVALALYCFLRHPDDYRAAVLRGANTNGDSDSVASISGAFSGARLGLVGIPSRWVQRIEKTDYMDALATRLALRRAISFSREGQAPVPFDRSYWVVPGRLLAGCYPGSQDQTEAGRKLRGLVEHGIRSVVDLMEPGEVNSFPIKKK
jgi:ADP-ribosylglycohydrolase